MFPEIEVLMRAGNWEAAAEACRARLSANPINGLAHAYEGICHFRLARYAEAEPCFRRAYTLDPKLGDAAVKHAQCLDKLKRYREAMDVVKEWMPKRPNDIALLALYDHLKCFASSEEHDGWERSVRTDLKLIATGEPN